MSKSKKPRNKKYNARKANDQMDSINDIHGAQPRVIFSDAAGFSRRANTFETNEFVKSINEEEVMNTQTENVINFKKTANQAFGKTAAFASKTKSKVKSLFVKAVAYVKTTREINRTLRNNVIMFNMGIAAVIALSAIAGGATAASLLVFFAAQLFSSIVISELFSLFHGFDSVVADLTSAH
jgi:hypothetical protein